MSKLAQSIVIITMNTQKIEQLWHSAGIANPRGNSCAVEVGAQGHALDAQALYQVIEMAYQYFKRHIGVSTRVFPQITDGEINANQSTRLFDCIKLLISQVARAAAKLMNIRVGRDQRRFRESRNIPETFLVDV